MENDIEYLVLQPLPPKYQGDKNKLHACSMWCWEWNQGLHVLVKSFSIRVLLPGYACALCECDGEIPRLYS